MNGLRNAVVSANVNDQTETSPSAFQLINKQKVALGFDNAASQYNDLATLQREIANQGLTSLERMASNAASHLLDIGCGTASSYARLQGLAKQVTGIDISHSMLKHAMRNNSTHQIGGFTGINGDAESLPIHSKSVDIVYSSMALQWCQSPAQSLAEIYRVLKPGGSALLCVLTGESFNDLQRGWQYIGLPSRINKFHSQQSWLNASRNFDWSIESNTDCFVSYHENLFDMLGSIKRIGANTKLTESVGNISLVNSDNCNRFFGKQEIRALSAYLKLCNANNELFALDYQLIFITIKK